jgi:eukaryotic-like serine/threonine-protein kinase
MTPLDQLTAALAGRYEVEREIGAGGMATVYLARDLKHNRKVALKVLKPELGAVLGVERFLSEIQVTANLQHPNLLPLFDSGEANGLLFYVMPFVEGESLRARLDREKQLPVDEAVRLTVAIAGALDYAHQHGVIHRDMKPENVLLQAGQPVIADFGIALAVSNAGGARVTQTGLSLGTPQYMSPEQATGDRTIDARSDLYSLAAMTYEMLVGDPPHVASTSQAIIAKVLTERPPSVLVARPTVGEAVAHAVERGLEKLPADRWSSTAEFADAMRGKLSTGAMKSRTHATMPGSVAASGAPSWMRAALAATTVVAVVGLSVAAWFATRPLPGAPAVAFEVGLPDSVELYGGGGTKLALSRDGTKLVIVGVKNGRIALYLRRLDDPVAQLIRGSERESATGNVSPGLSADGERVVFQDGTGAKWLPIGGGTPQVAADSGAGVRWGSDGSIVLTAGGSGSGGVWTGRPETRTMRLTARPDTSRGIYGFSWTDVLPGGSHALVTLITTASGPPLDSMRLGVVSLTDGSVVDLAVRGTNPQYVAPGYVVFGRPPGLVIAAPFSLRSRTITGPETVLLDGVWLGSGGAAGFAVSDQGALAFHRGAQGVRRNLVAVDRSGRERRIPGEGREYFAPRVSPDGARILASVGFTMGNRSTFIALVDAMTGATQPMTRPDSGYLAAWSRDGSRALLARRSSTGPGAAETFEIASGPWDQSASETVVASGFPRRVTQIAPGPVSGFAAIAMTRGAFNSDVLVAPMDSLGATRPFATGRGDHWAPSLSADGRLLAWASNESGPGSSEVYVSPVPGPGPRLRVSVAGGREPVWSRSGATLFFRGPRRMMMAEITPTPLRVGKLDSLFVDGYVRDAGAQSQNWDVFPGGNAFLMVRQESTQSALPQVVLNWQQMLAARGGAVP